MNNDIHMEFPRVSLLDGEPYIPVCRNDGGAARGKILGIDQAALAGISIALDCKPSIAYGLYGSLRVPFDADILDAQVGMRKN